MAFKRIVKDKAFWKSVVGMGIAFAIIYHFISMLFEYGGFQFSKFFEAKLGDGNWVQFVLGTILASLVYGFIISYGQFSSKIKKEERDR
ncbi:hypothetical protein [Gillisia limnaea]|uniref:Membrane protein n=1 Tax=Gillisia limnaea (strain DSM 15749 / LMG 21470 / R-8282) TaxID=865937 RepID=H2BVS2_GILLR|nr:hypothetical protein [Gillisia limnaea]EHQ01805.1 membrane protein [Gillisia limnaea DSM 15749]